MIVNTTLYLYVDQNFEQFFLLGSQLFDRGAWSASATYARGEAVEYNSGLFVALQAVTNTPPTAIVDENWSSLVIVEEYGGTVNYAYDLALQALQLAQTGTNLGWSAYDLAQSGTNIGWSAYLLAQAGTNIANAAYQFALYAAGTCIRDENIAVKAHHIDFGYGADQVWAGSIPYSNGAYTTVAQALDGLLYVPTSLTFFTNSVGNVEVGGTVPWTTLSWGYNKSLSTLTITGIGSIVPTSQTSVVDTGPWTTNKSWTISGTDGQTVSNGSSTIGFYYKRYWGNNASTTLNDAQVIALSSELSTTRVQSRTMTLAAEYAYFAYPDSWGAATFTVNGLLNTAWTLVTRAFVNASGATATYRIYRSDNLLTGTYQIAIT